MTSRQMAVAEAPSAAPAEEIIEITDDMILELQPRPQGKLLFFPPPLPRAQPLPAPRSRRRKRGIFPVVPYKS